MHCFTFGKYFGSRCQKSVQCSYPSNPLLWRPFPENHSKEGNNYVYQSVHRNVQAWAAGYHQSPSCPVVLCRSCILCAVPLLGRPPPRPNTHTRTLTHTHPLHDISLPFASITGRQGLPSLPQWTGQDLACSQCSANIEIQGRTASSRASGKDLNAKQNRLIIMEHWDGRLAIQLLKETG